MDLTKFKTIISKQRDNIARYRSRVEVARAHVEVSKMILQDLERQCAELGGVISYDAAKERNELNLRIRKQRAKLANAEQNLSEALRGGKQIDDILNN